MEASPLIITLIIICLSLIVLLVAAKPLKMLFSIVFNGVLGAVGIYLASLAGVSVGINVLTVGFVGILGLPGFCALVLIARLL